MWQNLQRFVCICIVNWPIFLKNKQEIILTKQLDFEIVELKFNAAGNVLLVRGTHKLRYIVVPNSSDIAKNDQATLFCEFVARDKDTWELILFFELKSSGLISTLQEPIVKTEWHPQSDVHLAVLTSDKLLRLYNLSVNPLKPEQFFSLETHVQQHSRSSGYGFIQAFRISSFAFGTGNAWSRFCVYFTTEEDSNIYVLCPVIPFNMCVIKSNQNNKIFYNFFFKKIV